MKEAKHLYHSDKTDFYLFMASALSTLMLGIEEGIITGVILSIAVLVYRVSYPHFAEIGMINNGKDFRNVNRFPDAETKDEIIMMRFDAQLYFANSNFLKKTLIILFPDEKPKFFILDASPICIVDSTSVHMLHDFIMELKGEGITFLLPTSLVR